MKANIQISLYSLLLVLGSFLTACEVIPGGERDKIIFTPSDPNAVKRTSLLIEYSGWKCTNCPTAAEEAHHLKEQYGENLVVVVMHPETNPNTKYTNNKGKVDESVKRYICPEADSIYLMMGGTRETNFPTGNINMVKDDTDGYFKKWEDWATLVSQAYSDPKPILLSNEAYCIDTNVIFVTTDITNLDTKAIEATVQIWLTEDSIIGKQEGALDPKNYVHNHLMRASISPIWGEKLPIDAHMTQQMVYEYTLPESVKKENCNIVSIVSINGEVVQACENKITLE